MTEIIVGKKYKGLVNGVIFRVVSYNPKDDIFEVLTNDGKRFYHSKSFLERLMIEVVE